MMKFKDFFTKKFGNSLESNEHDNFIYMLFDLKAKTFMEPFVCSNHEVAKRTLSQVVNGVADTVIRLYPNDFNLFCVGSYNINSGIITPCLDFIVHLSDLVIKNVSTDILIDDAPVVVSNQSKTVSLFPVNSSDVCSTVSNSEVINEKV